MLRCVLLKAVGKASHKSFWPYLKRQIRYKSSYDVLVVGGGHAGCEAATAAARMGLNTALVTHKFATVGEMSCNPSFGGIGKGHLMKEVDALDGVCGRIADKAGINFRVLNKSNGPAVWGPRAQMDRDLYRKYMQAEINSTKNLSIIESAAEDILLTDPEQSCDNPETKAKCCGVVLESGEKIYSKNVVLTTGTFLRGQINFGMETRPAGRLGDKPSIGLAQTIEQLGFKMGRLKTGTPPRLLKSSINLDTSREWEPDKIPDPFSFMNEKVSIDPSKQLSCFTAFTKPNTLNKIIMDSLDQNRHVTEEINGPRYCPSIESKVLKFGEMPHQVWIEPEGLESDIIYLQGFSCTMPEEIQRIAVKEIEGFDEAVITQIGYGVEYDYMDPRQISTSLETNKVQNLFFAGQINGTTGYEEAATQGIMAGINAGLKVYNTDPFTISRSEGYIGVLIDDLTTQGTNEPYRMFTTRSEFRLLLRPDNADLRLTEKGYKEAKCVGDARLNKVLKVKEELAFSKDKLKSFKKSRLKWRDLLQRQHDPNVSGRWTAFQVLAQTNEDNYSSVLQHIEEELNYKFDHKIMHRIRIDSLYDKMVKLQQNEIDLLKREEQLVIPDSINYSSLMLKIEIREKLEQCRPQNIAAASRIQGMTPSALVNLLRYVKRYQPTQQINVS